MKLTERINVLIQAASLSQKNGILTLDDAVKVKTAIDVISSGILNQNFTSAINVLIEIAVISQKKGAYNLKDAHMIYLAVEGIENELQKEVSRLNMEHIINEQQPETQQNTKYTSTNNIKQKNIQNNNKETVISIPPRVLKRT